MRRVLTGTSLALLAASSAPAAGGEAAPRFQRGMVLGLFSDGEGTRYRRDLREMRDLGVDSVSIPVAWATPDVRSTTIVPRDDLTPSDDRLRAALRAAGGDGMRRMLFPLVYVDDLGEGEWRGTLRPRDRDAWWTAYERFILHYATIAAGEGVETLSIGSELCSMEGDAGRWRRLAARVRQVYPGRLTYSANWDHLDPVLDWMDVLDLAGMNGYQEVGGEDATVEEMVRSWRPVLERVRRWQSRHGKPVLVTEIGYPSRVGGTAAPWDHTRRGAPAPEEQARGYEAFFRAWIRVPWLCGTFPYMWYGTGGRRDTGYTPRGKPASSVISRWYTRAGSLHRKVRP